MESKIELTTHVYHTRLPLMIRLDLFGDKLCLVGHCRESILSLLVGLTPASSSAMSELPRQYDLIRVVGFGSTLRTTELLAYIMGCVRA